MSEQYTLSASVLLLRIYDVEDTFGVHPLRIPPLSTRVCVKRIDRMSRMSRIMNNLA